MLTSTPALAPKRDDQRSLSDLEKLLNDTKKCLEQQELTYRNLMAEKKDGDKALQSKIQTLEDSLTEVRAQNIRLSSQLQYTNEKEKLLQVIDHSPSFEQCRSVQNIYNLYIFNNCFNRPYFLIGKFGFVEEATGCS